MSKTRRPQNNTNESIDSIIERISILEAGVSAFYYSSAASVGVTASTGSYNYDTQVVDTHSAVTTGANVWKFTCPPNQGGTYILSTSLQIAAGTTAGRIFVRKNGTAHTELFQAPLGDSRNGTVSIALNPGDYVGVHSSANTTAEGQSGTNGFRTWITIIKAVG